ncbi:MAG: arylmalonate decarboxylase [Steroidobacteraceae bacterium]
MSLSRRQLLQWAGLAASLAIAKGASAAGPRKLGLIFPPAGRGVPEEGVAMYGDKIEFVVEGLGLEKMTPEGYDSVVDRIGPAAEKLAARGAEAIVLMGTSLSFYKGEAFNATLARRMHEVTGLPATTMSTAVVDALKSVKARRVVAATAYNDEVNGRLRAFLSEHGFEVLAVKGLGIEAIAELDRVTQPQLVDFGARVFGSVAKADSILMSCGGLRTLEILDPLEKRCAAPAVSSTPHALFAGARLLGLDGRATGYGRLLST